MPRGPQTYPTILEQCLLDNAHRPDECWRYPGYINPETGYGHAHRRGGQVGDAHRVAYELVVGPVPDGLVIDHLCRNRWCCNPHHCEPVTQRVNLMRGAGPNAEQVARTHCPKGHPLSGDNLYIDPRKGKRGCKACRATQGRAAYYRRAHGIAEAPAVRPDYRTHCLRGHPREPGRRDYSCRICMRDHQRRYREKRRQQSA